MCSLVFAVDDEDQSRTEMGEGVIKSWIVNALRESIGCSKVFRKKGCNPRKDGLQPFMPFYAIIIYNIFINQLSYK